jgi:hypothetical protein
VKLTFIGGTGRCGTSITRKLLGHSEDVATLPFEHRILIDPDGPIEFFEALDCYRDPYKIDIALSRMFNHLYGLDDSSILRIICDSMIKKNSFLFKRFNLSKYSGWKLSRTFSNYHAAVQKFQSRLELLTYNGRWAGAPSYKFNNQMHYFSKDEKEKFRSALQEFYYSLVTNFLQANCRKHFIEDSTWNITHIKSLSQVFPQAKFLHVYRDPRDVIASFLTQRWMPNEVSQVVKIYQGLIMDILEKTSKDINCYSLKFEKLVADKDAELSSLCTFLDIDYSKGIRSFELQHGNIGRYHDDFNKETISYLNDKLAPQIELLGYDK